MRTQKSQFSVRENCSQSESKMLSPSPSAVCSHHESECSHLREQICNSIVDTNVLSEECDALRFEFQFESMALLTRRDWSQCNVSTGLNALWAELLIDFTSKKIENMLSVYLRTNWYQSFQIATRENSPLRRRNRKNSQGGRGNRTWVPPCHLQSLYQLRYAGYSRIRSRGRRSGSTSLSFNKNLHSAFQDSGMRPNLRFYFLRYYKRYFRVGKRHLLIRW